jgi:PPOX class probable FMN-dependent enzyme
VPEATDARPVIGTAPHPAAGDRTGYVELASVEDLPAILGTPHPIVIEKVHDRLTEQDRSILLRAPFCALATSDARGDCDVSPRGGVPGFTHVLDPGTLALPDRPGNRRSDSFRNIFENPRVGLLYLIPGAPEILRINGRARVLRDAPFFDAMIERGQRPGLALLVEIDEIYLHCPAALRRSGLWQPETWAAQGPGGITPA